MKWLLGPTVFPFCSPVFRDSFMFIQMTLSTAKLEIRLFPVQMTSIMKIPDVQEAVVHIFYAQYYLKFLQSTSGPGTEWLRK